MTPSCSFSACTHSSLSTHDRSHHPCVVAVLPLCVCRAARRLVWCGQSLGGVDPTTPSPCTSSHSRRGISLTWPSCNTTNTNNMILTVHTPQHTPERAADQRSQNLKPATPRRKEQAQQKKYISRDSSSNFPLFFCTQRNPCWNSST